MGEDRRDLNLLTVSLSGQNVLSPKLFESTIVHGKKLFRKVAALVGSVAEH